MLRETMYLCRSSCFGNRVGEVGVGGGGQRWVERWINVSPATCGRVIVKVPGPDNQTTGAWASGGRLAHRFSWE